MDTGHGVPEASGGPVRFALLASAIAGRPVDVAPAASGAPAWTDGATIFVDPGLGARDALCCVALQASLLGAGSLTPQIAGQLARRPALTRRYLAVEGHRALATLGEVLPGPVRRLVDPATSRRSDSPAASLAVAAGRGEVGEPPPAFGTIRPRHLRVAALSAGGADPGTRHAPRAEDPGARRELDDEEEDDRPGTDLLSSPVGGGGGIGRLLKRLLGDGRTASAGPPGADPPTRRSRAAPRPRGSVVSSAALPVPAAGATDAPPPGASYPEWDVGRRRYRPDWCTVRELEPTAVAEVSFVVPDTRALRRCLSRVGLSLERRGRQLQGTDIDIDAAVEARVDVAAGAVPDEAVYVDIVRRRRDLAVLLLLDVSGSAGEPGAAGGIVHEHQRVAAAQLTTVLSDLGDRVALYAFRSHGRASVQVLPLKRFDDPMGRRVLQRIGGLRPGAYTRLGAAIRHGAAVLEREAGMSRRLLVVLSDGFAYDHGYEGEYGEADARRALAESRRRGTGCLCLSIGAARDPEALRRVFGTAAHAGMARVDELPDRLAPLFRFALRSAEAQRRVAQRRVRTQERLDMERKTA